MGVINNCSSRVRTTSHDGHESSSDMIYGFQGIYTSRFKLKQTLLEQNLPKYFILADELPQTTTWQGQSAVIKWWIILGIRGLGLASLIIHLPGRCGNGCVIVNARVSRSKTDNLNL